MKKSKIEQWLVYVSLMPWGTFPGSKDRLSKEKNNFITGKYWDHNYAVYGLIRKSYITKKKKAYLTKELYVNFVYQAMNYSRASSYVQYSQNITSFMSPCRSAIK